MPVMPLGTETDTVAFVRSVGNDLRDVCDTLDARNAALIPPRAVNEVQPTLGMFLGGALSNTPEDFALRYQHFSEWLGKAPKIIVDFAGDNSWADADGSLALLNDAMNVCGTAKGVQLCLAYPLAVDNRKGALGFGDITSGSQDAILEHLCTALLSRDMGNTIFRLGHEYNGSWFAWAAAQDVAGFVAAYRYVATFISDRIPTAEFVLSVDAQKEQIEWGKVWPGHDVVDFIGIDVYDQYYGDPAGGQPARWNKALNEDWGLRWAANWARTMGKPWCIPEWGTGRIWQGTGTNQKQGGGQDNAAWVDYMADFINNPANGCAWHAFWNRDSGSGYESEIFPVGLRPNTSERFRMRFGA